MDPGTITACGVINPNSALKTEHMITIRIRKNYRVNTHIPVRLNIQGNCSLVHLRISEDVPECLFNVVRGIVEFLVK